MDPTSSPSLWLGVVIDVIFGRWLCRKVGPLAEVGDSDLSGKVVLVTGPTSGIGRETAKELVRRNAHVILACRNTAAGDKLVQEMALRAEEVHQPPPSTQVVRLDLGSLASVRACAAALEAQNLALDVLVCNAGIFSMSGPRQVTEEGFEAHFACNYLAHFLLTMLLLPALRRARASEPRVVMVASKLHEFGVLDWSNLTLTKGYTSLRAYGQSKLAQIMFCYELQRRVAPELRLRCFSVHPGNVLTDVVRSLPGIIQWLYRVTMPKILLSGPEGARATLFAATSSTLAQGPISANSAAYIDQSCQVIPSSKRSYDVTQAAKLWDESVKLVFPDNKDDRATIHNETGTISLSQIKNEMLHACR